MTGHRSRPGRATDPMTVSKGRHRVGSEGGSRWRALRSGVYAGCGAALLAGCASMPDSGDLSGVESTPRQDTQVRVFAMPPREGAPPADILQGFLEALTSDDPGYATARQYLTPQAARSEERRVGKEWRS